MTDNSKRPPIPRKIQSYLWLRAGGRCEFRGCNKILYEDNVTKDPINESNIAHIISWTSSGPRGDEELSPKLATDISNLMLVCPEHNHLVDSQKYVKKYTTSILQNMKQEHEKAIRELTDLQNQPPRKIIELKSMIHGQRPSITEKEEADAIFPFYPHREKIIIDVCEIEELETARKIIESKIKKQIINSDGDDLYAVFIMARIALGCCLGYAIGNKVPAHSYQHFRDTEDWKWKTGGGTFSVLYPEIKKTCKDINLFINISGIIDKKLIEMEYPTYMINADHPGFSFLQSWEQVLKFRKIYREMLDKIRYDCGEDVIIHMYLATPNPINFEIGKGIMKNIDPTIILYDKSSDDLKYKEQIHLHDRIRK